ncbi:MAG: RadC family protein [Clostridia bacterium]|nr:RadC family protein [Clostridia bacterium]
MNEHAGHRNRLRESFIQNGIEGMADHQVLELLLTYALPRVDVNPLAHRLLGRFGSLEGVLSARSDQLKQVEGVGDAAAVFLSLLGQVDRRMLLQRFSGQNRRPSLATPSALGGYMLALSLQDRYETLRLVCLNKKYELIWEGVISAGSLGEVLADTRPILETALVHKACFIALGHNHPSGDLTPSPEDEAAAQRIEAAAEAMGIGVADQFILGRAALYSLRSRRVLLFSAPDAVRDMTLEEYGRRS